MRKPLTEGSKSGWEDLAELTNCAEFNSRLGLVDMWTLMGTMGLSLSDSEENTRRFFDFVMGLKDQTLKFHGLSQDDFESDDVIEQQWLKSRGEDDTIVKTESTESTEDVDDVPGEAGMIYTRADGSELVLINGIARGGTTEFFWDTSDDQLYYWGEDPSVPSDRMELDEPWASAESLDSKPVFADKWYGGEIPERFGSLTWNDVGEGIEERQKRAAKLVDLILANR